MPGHVLIEVQPRRRLVCEHDETGRLVRIRIEPQSVGPAGPPPGPMPRPPRAVRTKARKPEPVVPEADTSALRRGLPVPLPAGNDPGAPAALPEPTPAAERAPVRVVLAPTPAPAAPAPLASPLVAAAPALPLLEIITEPLVAPAPRRVDVLAPRMARLAIPRPAVAAPLPTPMPSVVERALEAAAWQDAPPVEAPTPRPAPPRGFEILAVERVVAAPPPRAIVEAPPPAPAPGPEPEVAVRVEIQGPEPEPEAPSVVEIETAAAPEPQPLAPRIPDLDGRIDALLRAREGAPRRRRRSPLDVPRFAPLRRDAWEDRLDAVLSR